MKILIVSDTHGADEHLEEVLIREAPFDMLIHCGDVERREEYIEAVAECPCYMVAGNNDFFSDLPSQIVVTVGEHRMFVTHGHSYGVSWGLGKLLSAAVSRNCDVVLFGHTHRPLVEKAGGILCVNPGSLTFPRQQGRRPSYAVMTVEEKESPEVKLKFL